MIFSAQPSIDTKRLALREIATNNTRDLFVVSNAPRRDIVLANGKSNPHLAYLTVGDFQQSPV